MNKESTNKKNEHTASGKDNFKEIPASRDGLPAAWLVPLLAALGIGGKLALDRYTLVKPVWPEERAENKPIPLPPVDEDPPFHRTALAADYEKRRRLYMEWALENRDKQKDSEKSYLSIWSEILFLESGTGAPCEEILQKSLDFVNRRRDCSDFVVNGLIRLAYKYFGSGKLTTAQEEAIRETLLNFNYWMDEPNPLKTDMIHFTENHQILFHTAEYLAGQLFPDQTFSNNNRSGRRRMDHARPLIERWLDYHSRTGFAEWDSPNYYPLNIAALLNLVDFCQEKELSEKAEKVVNLIVFDIAVDSFYGQYASTHGRAEVSDIKSGAGDDMMTFQALLWGLGRFQDVNNVAAVSLATSNSYNLPAVLEAIGQDNPEELINCERHSIKLTEEDAFFHNLSFRDYRDAPRWLGMGIFLHPQVVDAMVKMADNWDFWHYGSSDHDRYEPLKKLARLASRLGILGKWSDKIGIDLVGAELTEVNKMTYRTPDYMLSCAQDYRKGEMGFQQHIWQATLSPYAVVFTTNPDALTEDSNDRPNYWAGNGRLPRAAQHKNLLISLYNTDRNRGLLERHHHAFTHAYFPRFAFDRIEEKRIFPGGGWIFAQKDDAYIALYSHLSYKWQHKGPDAGKEIIALGRRNSWLCLMGRRAVDGSFDEFMEGIVSSKLSVEGLNVDFDAPRIGRVTFGWNEPFTVNGREILLKYYPRWDNPYCTAEFNTNRFQIKHGRKKLSLEI